MSDDATTPTPTPDRRAEGQAQMRAVYGWDIEPSTPFETQTVDHLFGEIWTEGKLSVRDRRLVLIGLAAGSGLEDVATLQLDAALRLGELDPDDLRSLVVLLAHYAGWPRAAKLNSEVETLLARHAKAAAKAAREASADDHASTGETTGAAGAADSAAPTGPGPGAAPTGDESPEG